MSAGARDARGSGGENFVRSHPELRGHVDLACGNEGVNAGSLRRADGRRRSVDVVWIDTRKPRDDRSLHSLGDRPNGLGLPFRCDWKTGFDDIDSEARDVLGDLDLLLEVETNAGGLFPVPQRRVE